MEILNLHFNFISTKSLDLTDDESVLTYQNDGSHEIHVGENNYPISITYVNGAVDSVINVIRSSYGKNIDRELVKEICEKLDFIPIMDDDLGDY